MHLPQLIGLALFFAGVVLHVFFLTIVSKRPKKEAFERFLISLVSCLLVWYAGNFLSLLLRQMDFTKVQAILGWVDAIAFGGLAILPALMLHTHLVFFRGRFPSTEREIITVKVILGLLYGSVALLPIALPRLFSNPEQHPLQKLGPFEMPFIVILGLAYYSSAYLQFRITKHARNHVERKVFSKLFFIFLAIPLFTFWIFGLGGGNLPQAGEYLVYAALLASLLPSFLVTYYIYRFQFLHIQVHQSLATALVVLGVIVAYLAGIRSFVKYLETELGAPEILLETTFLVIILLFFPTLSDWLRYRIARIFAVEIQRYRRIADSIGRSSSTILSVPALQQFIEETLRREFPDTEIKIYLDPDSQKGGKNIFPLRSGNIRIGSLEMVFPEARISTGHREGIRLLAAEIASAFERCRLLERQFKLREELARKNHLEDLGRMAATIAHNVKNPLSSMKTLIQLQIEAENLTPDQKGELQMMLEEINRLAKTVTSLLRFSKIDAPLSSDQSESGLTSLQSIVDSVVGVYEGDLHTREITTKIFVDSDTLIPKSRSEAVRDILSNLISNAIEASDDKGMIHLELRKEGGFIVLVLQDEGRGIPEQIRDRIMDPFVTTKQSGTGLGLAIVQRRLEQLQGKIEIESPLQMGGARFTVTFPA